MNHKDPITIERDTLLNLVHMLSLMATMLGQSFTTIDKMDEQTDRLKYINKLMQDCNKSLKENQQ